MNQASTRPAADEATDDKALAAAWPIRVPRLTPADLGQPFDPDALQAADLDRVAKVLARLTDVAAAMDDDASDCDAGSLASLVVGLAAGRLTGAMVELAVKTGQVLRDAGHAAAEQAVMTGLSQATPDFHWPWFALGRLALDADDANAALPLLERAIRLSPGFGWARMLMYRTLLALGRQDEATEHLDLALIVMPEMRPSAAINRLGLLSHLCWSRRHAEVVSDVLALGPPSRTVSAQILALFGDILTPATWDRANADACIAHVDQMLLAQKDGAVLDFRLLPVLFLSALSLGCDDPARAGDLLASFEIRMPGSLDTDVLPENFLSVMQAASEAFLRRLYLTTWPRSAAVTSFCLRVAETHLTLFRNPGLARMLTEAAISDSGTETEADRQSESLRIASYSAEQKWFETLNILRRRDPAGFAQSTANLKIYVSALSAVTEASPSLAFAAARQVMDIIDQTAQPWELADSVQQIMHRHLREAMRRLYDQGKGAAGNDRDAALALWEGGLSEACDLIERFEGFVSVPRADEARDTDGAEVLILTSPYLPQVLHYRAEQLADLLETAGITAAIIDLTKTPVQSLQMRALLAQAVVIQRQPATFDVMQFIAWCRRTGVRTLFDIDDQIFDSRISPLPISDYAGRIGRDTHLHLQFDCAYFRQAMARCDEVIVSTEPLRAQVLDVLPTPRPVHLRRNLVGEPLRFARQVAHLTQRQTPRDPDAPLEVFYGSGTKAHKAYFDETVMPALLELVRQRADVKVTLFGDFDLADLPPALSGRIVSEKKMLDYPAYLQRLAQADISIAPLNSNPVTDGKSELKWFEAACLGIPSVVSPTANYRDVIADGTHALFADTTDEWVQELVRLVDDAALRTWLVQESKALIARDYEVAQVAAPLAQALRLTPAPDAQPARTRKRLLVVNTYFRPQSIGGATRIAESYAADLVRRYGDRYEIFALCADAQHRTARPYGLTVMQQDGVTVVRCAVPTRDWADPLDPQVEAVVAQLAQDLQIDVAHVHSVQILTASVVEGLVKARVPVVLSLHDGWWLSEHQFLVDDEGKAFLPRPDGGDLAESTCARMTVEARLRRRSVLARQMRLCHRRLAVSEAFAEVYRQAGVAGIDTLDNGVALPADPPARPSADPDAPLRIGFIGGLSAHKGLRLLEAVARSESLPRLEFVLVDHRYEQGYERHGTWGDSRVTYIGKASQARVAEVYARFDILAAPSIWPESYGLVAREARAHGLPVIAGNRGDIGRGIVQGRDGWVVDVADDTDLRALLRQLNDDPASGRLHPTPPEVSTVEQAVDRLVAILDEVV